MLLPRSPCLLTAYCGCDCIEKKLVALTWDGYHGFGGACPLALRWLWQLECKACFLLLQA